MSAKLLTEHHLEFLSLKGCCIGWSESTLVKMPHCWKSHVTAQMQMLCLVLILHFQAFPHYLQHHICMHLLGKQTFINIQAQQRYPGKGGENILFYSDRQDLGNKDC